MMMQSGVLQSETEKFLKLEFYFLVQILKVGSIVFFNRSEGGKASGYEFVQKKIKKIEKLVLPNF